MGLRHEGYGKRGDIGKGIRGDREDG